MARQLIDNHQRRTLAEYIDVIDKIQGDADGPLWYRGCSRKSAELLPSLYRPRINPKAADGTPSELEAQLVARFRDRSLPYHSRSLSDDIETLFFMQHYGVPTRLLDWTGNPFVGLFFALRSAKFSLAGGGALAFANDAVVWVLDPTRWNRAALEHISFRGGPLDPSHDALGPYKLIGDIDRLAAHPVAIYGAHNSQRIVAQQGTFVIYGSNITPMERLYRSGRFPAGSLIRIVLPKLAIPKLRASMFAHGITEGSLFPDLEGLGRDLRQSFGFRI